MISQSVIVRHMTCIPYLWKKIVVTLIAFIFCVYFCVEVGFYTLFVQMLFYYFLLFRKYKAKNESIFTAIKRFYTNLYKKYLVDVLPIQVDVNEEEILVNVENAEYIKGNVVNKNYIILKDEVHQILHSEEDNYLMCVFNTACVDLTTNGKIISTIMQNKNSISFYADKEYTNKVVEMLKNNGYEIFSIEEDLKNKEDKIEVDCCEQQ